MKPSVLILGGGSDQKLLVAEFNKRGYYTIIIDYLENPAAKEIAHKHYQESTYDEIKIKEIAIKNKVSFITTISTDQPLYYAVKVSEELSLPCHITYKQVLLLTNKYKMKPFLELNNIPTAKFFTYKMQDKKDLDIAFPCLSLPLIVKPADSSGSRGINKVANASDLSQALDKAYNASRSKEIIVEEFIEGIEISVDCIVVQGKCEVLMISENHKMIYNDTPLFIKSIFPSAISKKAEKLVIEVCQKIADVYNLKNTPLFVQMIVRNDDVFVIELSARIAGGSKPMFYREAKNDDLIKRFVDILTNQKQYRKKKQHELNEKKTALYYIYCYEGIIESFVNIDWLKANNILNKLVLYKKEGELSLGLKDGSCRVGAALFKAESFNQLMEKFCIFRDNFMIINSDGENIFYKH
jgi:formate-dependent phosphoribosylglycinamide formyltransferase (GAR transformylase)